LDWFKQVKQALKQLEKDIYLFAVCVPLYYPPDKSSIFEIFVDCSRKLVDLGANGNYSYY
jgi:hypothetical protein